MLLDTHVLLWFLEDDPKLPPQIKQMIEVSNDVFVSIIALWEVAIKLSIRKLELRFEFQKLTDFLTDLDIKILTISFEDIKRYVDLPLYHRDPFDRILIAQSINHAMSIVSADPAFDAYPIRRVWA
ncbi:type II toxin-antitoxin system VapC family toxin [Thermoleptolyngbya sp. C42_A2020_037]|uniref:type II toxin-antitoxin system VapC family toxin n=1 Tax=Thermoleptolyngbya sp. C42_A2020_037 TaxID=2747799 RepID=UPI001A0A2AE7|nr:type II toxin-antitoxin system VapC family toxin [Thermoleptolyngbya sp. C42_A2020_037]MBF2085223.1 type II toxin-antitoxin system VapC family toxin [Thermoleptolyngbya sp. C42_A2020_037]